MVDVLMDEVKERPKRVFKKSRRGQKFGRTAMNRLRNRITRAGLEKLLGGGFEPAQEGGRDRVRENTKGFQTWSGFSRRESERPAKFLYMPGPKGGLLEAWSWDQLGRSLGAK
jgi:hypothetical protein